MTLSDLWPGFQGHDIFEVKYRKKRCILKTKLLVHNRKLYVTYVMYYVWWHWLTSLVDLHNIRPANRAGLFLQPRSPHGAVQRWIKVLSLLTASWPSSVANLSTSAVRNLCWRIMLAMYWLQSKHTATNLSVLKRLYLHRGRYIFVSDVFVCVARWLSG